jgi:hypothetical protein
LLLLHHHHHEQDTQEREKEKRADLGADDATADEQAEVVDDGDDLLEAGVVAALHCGHKAND